MNIEVTKLTLSNCNENIDLTPAEISERYGSLPVTKCEMEALREAIQAKYDGKYVALFTWKVLNKSKNG